MPLGTLAMVGVFGLLDVSTATPDALCPPLPEVEAALAGLVGGLPEGRYSLRYALERSATGGKSIRLELREEEQLLLERDLALDEGGCGDAARAIAVVVERYFERLVEEPPSEPSPDPPPDPPVGPEVPSPRSDEPVKNQPRETPEAPTPSRRAPSSFELRALVGWTERTAPEAGLGAGLSLGSHLSTTLDVSYVLLPSREAFERATLTNHSFRVVPALRLEDTFGDFVAGVSLLVPIGIEWARGDTLAEPRTAARALLGLGGGLHISSSRTERWGWSFEAGAATTFPDASRRFSVRDAFGQSVEVLSPAPWWLGVRFVGTFRPFL